MTKIKNRLLAYVIIAAFAFFALAVSVLGGTVALAADNAADPSMKLINGNTGVNDTAVINADGETELSVLAANGFGTRANMSALGADARFDVRDFETVISFDSVPVNMATVFSLQTLDTGTIGRGNGNGINVMLRRDTEESYTVVIYDQTGDIAYDVHESALTADEGGDVTISFAYGDDTASISVATDYVTIETESAAIKSAIDSHYLENDYLAYWSISSYYGLFGGMPSTRECKYTIRSLNGVTPRAHYTSLVTKAIVALEEGVNGLGDGSDTEDIDAVTSLNVFSSNSVYMALLSVADNSAALTARLNAAIETLAGFEQKGDYDRISAQFDAFTAALDTFDANNAISVRNVRNAYNSIDYDKIDTLSAGYKSQLEAKNTAVRAHANFAAFITLETDEFFKKYEDSVADSDAASLRDYKTLTSLTSEWESFARVNALSEVLSADKMAAYTSRAQNLEKVSEKSFYSRFWTEGDSWNASLTEHGIRASGKGDYGETLGFNQKLTLGENTSITFNIIYALKTLGANHLHIGFYPVSQTGTLGDSDGVRADFWFAGTTIEVKPANGKTELPLYSGAYLVVDDNGFYDVNDPDPDAGKYTVELDKRGNTLVLRINNLEMDIEGLDASLYDNGCYLTVSAMSVRGADNNDILITNAGGVNYDGYDPANDPSLNGGEENNGKNPGKKGCGCGGVTGAESVTLSVILTVAALAAVIVSVCKHKRVTKDESK